MSKILVTDDADLILALQESFLRRGDHEVLTTASATETLARVVQEQPDVVLLDARMDGSRGLECCRRLKADSMLKRIPVIMVADKEGLEACTAAGADAVIARPVSMPAVLRAVRQCLGLAERSAVRCNVSLKVDYYSGKRDGVGYTKDLSTGGLFLKSDDPFLPGDLLQMIFGLPAPERPTIHASGSVVRTVPGERDSHLIPGVGVRFDGLSTRDRKDIAAFVEARGGGTP
jgi:uncharacterized protein (TIGR02266 family)